MLSLNHGVYIIEKGYKKTVCPDGKYFHQNKLFFIFTLIIFSEHSYFLRKSQITPERKQRKKYFLTPFALHWNIQTSRKAFIYRLFRNLVRYSNSSHRSLISVISIAFSLLFIVVFAILAGIILTGIKIVFKMYSYINPIIYSEIQKLSLIIAFAPEFFYQILKFCYRHSTIHFAPIFLLKERHFMH